MTKARRSRLSACEPGGAPYVCDRCGAKGFNFDVHRCKGLRDLSKLPVDLLRELAYKRIDEDEAWRESEARAAGGPANVAAAIAELRKLGFETWSTGGGCTALGLTLAGDEEILVTDGEDGTGEPTAASKSLMVGLRNTDTGAEIECRTRPFAVSLVRVREILAKKTAAVTP